MFLFSSRCIIRSCPCSAFQVVQLTKHRSLMRPFPFFLTCVAVTPAPTSQHLKANRTTCASRVPQAFSHPPAFPCATTEDVVLTRTKTCASPSHASASSQMPTSRASASPSQQCFSLRCTSCTRVCRSGTRREGGNLLLGPFV